MFSSKSPVRAQSRRDVLPNLSKRLPARDMYKDVGDFEDESKLRELDEVEGRSVLLS